jgi:hypothetical protein
MRTWPPSAGSAVRRRRIRYDNLKPAVARVLKGRHRVESDRFVALRSHYGFGSSFCQPGPEGPHEKGGVEGGSAGSVAATSSPCPDAASLAELNDVLDAACERDDRRQISGRLITVAEHFVLEAQTLEPLCGEAFDQALVLSCRVDRKSRVCVRQCF